SKRARQSSGFVPTGSLFCSSLASFQLKRRTSMNPTTRRIGAYGSIPVIIRDDAAWQEVARYWFLFFALGKLSLQPPEVRHICRVCCSYAIVHALGPLPVMIFHVAVGKGQVGTPMMPISGAVPPHGLARVTIAERADVKRAAVAGSRIQKDKDPR